MRKNDLNVWRLLIYVGQEGARENGLGYVRKNDPNVWKLLIYVGEEVEREILV